MLNVSTGFKALLLGPNSFTSIFKYGAIQVYANPRPSAADAMPTVSPIATITNYGLPWSPSGVGNGIVLMQNGPYIVMGAGQNWELLPNAAAAGSTASWWRLMAPGDSGLPSITEPRIDGDIGVLGVFDPRYPEILIDDVTLVPNTGVPITSFLYTFPPLPGV